MCSAPPATVLAPERAFTVTGVVRWLGVTEPVPSCPKLFSPQQTTEPSNRTAHAWNVPAPMPVAAVRSVTGTGAAAAVVVPFPSCPYELLPQQRTVPSDSRAQVDSEPAAMAMAASARSSRVGHAAAASMARLRGLQVFALAFLFRLQSQLLGWGALINILKVDILNVMGIAMMAAAVLWGWAMGRATRIALFAIATAAIAMSTPLVREAAWLSMLPDPIEAYIRPLPGRTR